MDEVEIRIEEYRALDVAKIGGEELVFGRRGEVVDRESVQDLRLEGTV